MEVRGEVVKTKEATSLFIVSRKAKGLSPETIRWYEGILQVFTRQYRKLPTQPTAIERFLLSCQAGDERRHGYYRTLRCFYGFLQKRRQIKNPMDLIESPRRSRKQSKILTPIELNNVLNYPHRSNIKAALLFLTDSGARLGELHSLTIDCLGETPWGFTATITGKTGIRTIPISYETYHSLMITLPFKITKHHLGVIIAKAIRKADVEGTAHVLRHSFATLWQGDDLVLQQIMGHRHLSTTMMYRHLRIEMMLRQHSQFSPLKMVLTSSKSML